MANQLEIRAQIDTETVKALVLINGGGAVALLAFLPAVINKSDFESLVVAALWGILAFMLGVASAVIHNYLRRRCSLEYQRHNMSPPPGRLLGFQFSQPKVCFFSTVFMCLSILSFLAAGTSVAVTGIVTFPAGATGAC
jgi:hypothetical protein